MKYGLNGASVILNVDYRCFGNPTRAGFGGLLCQAYEIWILGFLGLLPGSFEILHEEFHIIYQGLLLAN